MVLVIFFIITLLILFLWRDSRKPENFPPGPKWLPVLGCIPLIKQILDIYKYHHLVWHHFANRYGPIVGFRVGRDRLIVISGREEAKEFYSREEFNGRPNGFFYRMRSFNRRLGIVFTDGHHWETQKRFTLKTLKQLGRGRYGMVTHVEKEAAEMIEYFKIKSKNGDIIDMHNLFDVPVLNVLWALLAGYRFYAEDERLINLLKLIHESFRVIDMSGGVLNQFPFIRHFFPEKSGYKKLLNVLSPLWTFLIETINETHDQIKDEDNPKSLMEAFILEMKKHSDRNSTFTQEQLLCLSLDLFQAGSETTSNTLGFGIIYILHNPRVLEKIRKELEVAVDRKRLPCLSDRPNLQYTEAVICEIQRVASVAPVGIAHRATDNLKLGKYVIPKDTIALVSLYGLNMDGEYWKDPQTFRPERFLDSEGRLIQHESFIPFGLGKRRCIGETLARSSMFLFFTSFFHSFDIILPENVSLPDTQGLNGITLSPKPYQAYLKFRNKIET